MAELEELDEALAQEENGRASDRMRHAVELVSAERRGFCDHRIVDALLTAKVDACECAGIAVSCTLDIPDDLLVPGVELCAVFSNLLDNALRACEEVHSTEKREASIEIKAHVAGESKTRRGHEFRGRGLAEHGWGLSILGAIAQRRDGSLHTECADGRFVAKVALRLAEDSAAAGVTDVYAL